MSTTLPRFQKSNVLLVVLVIALFVALAIVSQSGVPCPPPSSTAPCPTGDGKTNTVIVKEKEPCNKNEEKQCTSTFVKYHPSDFETLWMTNIDTWKDKTCPMQQQQEKENEKWISITKEQPMKNPDHNNKESNAVMSRMEYLLSCPGEADKTYYRFLEPIAGTTRHPGVCTTANPKNVAEKGYPHGGGFLFNKDYLSIDCTNILKSKKFFYFDLGASRWDQGCCGEGPSQAWFIEMYRKCGFEWTGFYLWEAKPYDPKVIFELVPEEFKPIYHWYNIPATSNTDKKNFGNPLNWIRRLVSKDDFLVLKIDIDTPVLEQELVDQLSADPELMALVDDFYFEHHVANDPMGRYWGTTSNKETMATSFALFKHLREHGVCGHAWV